MSIQSFEDVIAWQKAKALTIKVYAAFSDSRDYAFRDQIQRASVSVMNNIAEGFERKSNKEFKHFLFIAKGSCGEVRSMLQLAGELKYLDKRQSDDLVMSATEVSKVLSGFIKQL